MRDFLEEQRRIDEAGTEAGRETQLAMLACMMPVGVMNRVQALASRMHMSVRTLVLAILIDRLNEHTDSDQSPRLPDPNMLERVFLDDLRSNASDTAALHALCDLQQETAPERLVLGAEFLRLEGDTEKEQAFIRQHGQRAIGPVIRVLKELI